MNDSYKLFNELLNMDVPENLKSLGEGNIVFEYENNTYLFSLFKNALLKFKNTEDSLVLTEDWFSDVELLTPKQASCILQKINY